MSMGYDPSLHFNGEPEAVDSECDDSQKEPFDVVAEELCSGAVENELLAVDDGVLCDPSFSDAYCPRECKTEGKCAEKPLQNADTDETEKAARELRG